MAMTTITSVKLPENKFPHVEVNINDNTIRRYINVAEEHCRTLCVFRSPKGPDGLKTITGGIDEFINTYGTGSVSEYGQGLLNASALAATNAATLHCLRLTADDAKVANLHVYMRYRIIKSDSEELKELKLEDPKPIKNSDGTDTGEYVNNRSDKKSGVMAVYFVARSDDKLTNIKDLTTNTGKFVTTYDTTTEDKGESQSPAPPTGSTGGENGGGTESGSSTSNPSGEGAGGAGAGGSADSESEVETYAGTKETPTPKDAKEYPYAHTETLTFKDDNDKEWNEVWLFSVASRGKGKCGNALSIRIEANERLNKSTNRMNYIFSIFESGVQVETAYISFDESAMYRGKSMYIENVINGEDGSSGSDVLTIVNNENAIPEILKEYMNNVNKDTVANLSTFDPFLGIDRGVIYGRGYTKVKNYTTVKNAIGNYTSDEDNSTIITDPTDTTESSNETPKLAPSMDGYHVITEEAKSKDDYTAKDGSIAYPVFGIIKDEEKNGTHKINIQTTNGVPLAKGDDGKFDSSKTDNTAEKIRETETELLVKIFNGYSYTDLYLGQIIKYPYEGIMSTSRYPIDFVLDANYEYKVKMALANWCERRKHDFVLYLDNGTSENMPTKSSSYITTVDIDEATNKWNIAIDSYYGKIKDPYNQRIVEVTSTYNLARKLPLHWKEHNGKHIPYAGSMYGIIDSYLPNTVSPLMDKDLDAVHMNNCVAEHINYAQINSKGDVIRGTQSSRYPEIGEADILSNLTELNNAHIVLDIKKDCEKLLENFAYNFNESEDLIRFNRRAEVITAKYSAAQVKKISATFDRTADEAEYGILHLYIEVVHKNLVKIAIVDIDVNRNTGD